MASREARQAAIKRAVRTVAKSPWLRRKPEEPTPRPVLYDWQQDKDVITDFKLWNVFTVVIDPNITAGYVVANAEKPRTPEKIIKREAAERIQQAEEDVFIRGREYGDTVKPWGPGAHVTGLRPGYGPGVRLPGPPDPPIPPDDRPVA